MSPSPFWRERRQKEKLDALERRFRPEPREPSRRESAARLVVGAREPVRDRRAPNPRVKSAIGFRDPRARLLRHPAQDDPVRSGLRLQTHRPQSGPRSAYENTSYTNGRPPSSDRPRRARGEANSRWTFRGTYGSDSDNRAAHHRRQQRKA